MAQTKINNKKLIITSAVFLVLLIYFLVFEKQIQNMEKSKNNLFSYTTADIKKFIISKKESEIEIIRDKNDWLIKKPRELKASATDVEAYLYDVRNLQKEKEINKKAGNLAVYGLTNARIGLAIELTGSKDALLNLKLGEQNPDKSGYYALLASKSNVIMLENSAETVLDKDLMYFRDKNIFSMNAEDIENVKLLQDNVEYELTLDNKTWVLVKPVLYKELEQVEAKRVIGSILEINIKKFYDEGQKLTLPDTGLLAPQITIQMTDKNRRSFNLFIGKEIRDENLYYANKNNDELIFAVDKSFINDLITDIRKFEEEKKRKDEEKRTMEEKKKKEEEKKIKGKNDEKKK